MPTEIIQAFTLLANGEARWPLFIHGGVGTGKTYAAMALCDLLWDATYTTVEAMCDAVMQKLDLPWRDGTKDYVDSDNRKHVLFVDEIGEREKIGDLQYTTLKAALDYREYRCGRVGVWMSNLGREQIAKLYDDRIASRLCCGTVVELRGKDRRG